MTTTKSLCIALSLLISLSSLAVAENPEEETFSAKELALVKAAEQARIQAIARVYGAVVAVYGNDRQGGGSGVIYDPSGLALTNHHVVAAAGVEGWAGLADGKMYRWKLVGTDPGGDVAIIQLTGKDRFPVAPLGDSDTVRVGDWAMAMGNPFILAEDQKPTVTLGIVSGVRRYQAGAGLNTLVYGNCIQVDSSINPGNSGGPLFNLRGQVIGINGRGSFLERGRVNVGLGYAISSNQIKNFLPDLLATKIAQHGTLDALFRNQDGKVICYTLNLDAPIARAGLQLGDSLVSLDDQEITDANQYTNLLSTLSADWPVKLVYRRNGKQQTVWVRLLPLPYRQFKAKVEPTPKGEKTPRIAKPKISIDNPGVIRNESLNRQNCRRLIQQWQKSSIANRLTADKAVRISDDIFRNGRQVGKQTILIAAGGRFLIQQHLDGRTRLSGFDGKTYWTRQPPHAAETLKTSKALLDPVLSQAATLATLFEQRPLERFGKTILNGGDKADGRLAYRIKTIDDQGDWYYVWLSVTEREGRLDVKLLKSGADRDAAEPDYAVTYSQWRFLKGIALPWKRTLVEGISEDIVLTMTATDIQIVPNVALTTFEKPQDE